MHASPCMAVVVKIRSTTCLANNKVVTTRLGQVRPTQLARDRDNHGSYVSSCLPTPLNNLPIQSQGQHGGRQARLSSTSTNDSQPGVDRKRYTTTNETRIIPAAIIPALFRHLHHIDDHSCCPMGTRGHILLA